MSACSEKGIGVGYFSEYGRFQARIPGPQTGNVLLRREQYRWADDPGKSSDIARFIIGSKLANSRTVIHRMQTLLTAYQKRKQETLKHPILKENIKIGLLFHVQALLLSRHIRGDMDYHPAFIWR